jgi:hypothetical protein
VEGTSRIVRSFSLASRSSSSPDRSHAAVELPRGATPRAAGSALWASAPPTPVRARPAGSRCPRLHHRGSRLRGRRRPPSGLAGTCECLRAGARTRNSSPAVRTQRPGPHPPPPRACPAPARGRAGTTATDTSRFSARHRAPARRTTARTPERRTSPPAAAVHAALKPPRAPAAARTASAWPGPDARPVPTGRGRRCPRRSQPLPPALRLGLVRAIMCGARW